MKVSIKDTPKFKSSPIGMIPEDWDAQPIKAFGLVVTGNTPPTADRDNYEGTYMFVSPADLGYAKYIRSTQKTLSEKGFSITRKMTKGSLLFTCIGSTIGKMGIATDELTSNQQINAILINENNDVEFLYYELTRHVKRIKLLAGEQAVPIINKSAFEKIEIVRPPLTEQRKIAQILSLWDESIETLENLIKRKERRKKELMQQLLTGKKRFKEFKGEKWKLKELINFCVDSKRAIVDGPFGSNLKTIHYRNSGRPIVTSGYVTDCVFKASDYLYVDEEKFQSEIRSKVVGGDIVMAKIGARCGASAIMPLKHPDSILSGNVLKITIDSKENNINYVWFYLYWLYKNDQFISITSTGAQPCVSIPALKKIKIPCLSIIEQTKIASVLSSADEEIQTLKTQLSHCKQQKKGLMQVLLTGKKRVKVKL